MNTIAYNQKTLDNILGYLSKMDTKSKKGIIIKLTESITEKETEKKSVSSLFGSWNDNRDSDEIISEILNARKDSTNNTVFL